MMILQQRKRCDYVVLLNASLSSKFPSGSQITLNAVINNRKFKRPQIELIKFGGKLRDWLPFWSQFKKFHEIKCLLLATVPKSRARELVESFPSTAENYDKVIDRLRSRFGKEDLLVEVYSYVRELLKLVLNNAMSNQSKCNISTLYDKIETQVRVLATLGVDTNACSAMLYPLVESCLPEELLRTWQRAAEYTDKAVATVTTVTNRLERLMQFLKTEVEGAERISLAMEGFGLNNHQKRNTGKITEQKVPAAAGLINNTVSAKCVFCDGYHLSEKCFKAHKISYEEKNDALTKKRACFKCATVGESDYFRAVLHDLQSLLTQKYKGKRNPLNIMSVISCRSEIGLIENLVNVFNKGKLEESEEQFEVCLRQFEYILELLSKKDKSISKQRATDIELEINRFERLVQLCTIEKNSGFKPAYARSDIKNIYSSIKNILDSCTRYSDEADEKIKSKLTNLADAIDKSMTITDEERRSIVKAMQEGKEGLGKGRWFKCPNGHPFAIGECGGAMQVAKCPDCGVDIGGQNHALLSTNVFAGEMDGASHPAWSNAANLDMRNFQFD